MRPVFSAIFATSLVKTELSVRFTSRVLLQNWQVTKRVSPPTSSGAPQ